MKRFLQFLAMLVLALETGRSATWNQPEVDLAEFKKIKGVEVELNTLSDDGLTYVTVKLSNDNDFLFRGWLQKVLVEMRPQVLLEVWFNLLDSSGHVLVDAPLSSDRISDNEKIDRILGREKNDFRFFYFHAATKELPAIRLRFKEKVSHGTQITDVYLGTKPSRP